MINYFLHKIMERNDLTENETAELLTDLCSGKVPEAQAGAVLGMLRMKGEAVSELIGGAQLLRRRAPLIDCGGREAIDIVGTGGDGGISFNISTTAALVAAGAGAVVAKHGNTAATGKCGSADVLAALGFNLETSAASMEECIREHGIGFLFAKKIHPILGKVAHLRKELGIGTLFNMLGPLCNPAGVKAMVVGVYDEKLTELFASALAGLGVERALVVHGEDGLDEISCSGMTRVSELNHGNINTYDLYPELLIGETYSPKEIAGGNPQRNAEILRDILNGKEKGAPRAVVILNAAAACMVAGLAESIQDAIPLAEESIDSGKAMRKLEHLIEGSHFE